MSNTSHFRSGGGLVEFYQLEDFVAVVEEESFSRAAIRVFRTQSAVSQAIKRLEEELGTSLLDRDTHGFAPTESGRMVLDYARRILGIRDELVHIIEGLREAVLGRVSIAAHESAAHYVLPEVLKEYRRRHSAIQIEIQRVPVELIPRHVLERRADLGFVTSSAPFRDLRSIELLRDPLVLVVPPGHHLAGRADVQVRELGNEHFIAHHVRTPTTENVFALFEEHHTPLHIAARLWSYENVKEFVKQGMGIAVVPRLCVKKELTEHSLLEVPLSGLDFSRSVQVIFLDEHQLPDAARSLLELIRNWKWDLPTLPQAADEMKKTED
jgi:DNA-binding transcriptional LysR family regulator